jgi:nicotinamide-nucleotide amidase
MDASPSDAALLARAAALIATCTDRGLKIATAESCTGGLLAGLLTEIPGSSAVFERGFVTYSNEAKAEMIGVPTSLITAHGAVSEPVARAMAAGVQRLSGATWTIAVTGIAGPAGGSAEKPVGTVYMAVAGPAAPGTAGEGQSGLWQAGTTRGRAWIQAVGAGEALNRLRLRLDALAADSSPNGQQAQF